MKDANKIANEADFNALVNEKFPWFRYLRELTNGSKHFEAREHGFEAYRVAAAPVSFDVLGAGFYQGAWGGPIRHVSGSLPVGQDNKGLLMFDSGETTGERRYLPVVHVVEGVVRFWRDMLRYLHPGASIKSSAYHNDP